MACLIISLRNRFTVMTTQPPPASHCDSSSSLSVHTLPCTSIAGAGMARANNIKQAAGRIMDAMAVLSVVLIDGLGNMPAQYRQA